MGENVYVSLGREAFYKSFDLQRTTIYKIRKVDNALYPTLYQLSEEDGRPIPKLTFYVGYKSKKHQTELN